MSGKCEGWRSTCAVKKVRIQSTQPKPLHTETISPKIPRSRVLKLLSSSVNFEGSAIISRLPRNKTRAGNRLIYPPRDRMPPRAATQELKRYLLCRFLCSIAKNEVSVRRTAQPPAKEVCNVNQPAQMLNFQRELFINTSTSVCFCESA